MPNCITCGAALANAVLKCPTCQSYQGAQCASCGVPLPLNAKRCNVCQIYQNGVRRWIPQTQLTLALVLSLISILAAVVPPAVRWWNDRSVTEARVSGVEEHKPEEMAATVPMIRVAVTNRGTRPSYVRKATITFAEALGFGKDELPLEIAEVRERYVRPDETAYLHLASKDFVAKGIAADVLKTNNVTITLHVEETRRLGGRGIEERPDTVAASEIERWITYGAQ